MPDSEVPSSDHTWEVSPSNLPWVEELYLAYQQDPGSVDESWRQRFELLERASKGTGAHAGEHAHIYIPDVRGLLQTRMETTRNRITFTRAEQVHLLGKVTEAEVFEQFLQTKFLGAKRFSLEGAESTIPLIDRIIERGSRS